MACNTCNCQTTPCGCEKGLTTPPPCSVNTAFCPVPNPCAEEFSSDCIVYTGPELLCGDNPLTVLTSIIPTGISVSEALQILVNYVCNGATDQGNVYLRLNGTVTSSSIPLTWDSITGNTSYEIYMKLSSAPVGSFALVSTVLTTYATITGLLPNTSYDFYIEGATTNQKSMYIRITTLA
jgi:hypothetical protein